MSVSTPISNNYYSQNIARWKPDTSESQKVRDLGNSIKMIEAETNFIIENGYKPTSSIDFTKRLDTF